MSWKDTLKGGKADRRKPDEFDPHELEMGADDEHGEHTSSWHKAKEIAMDHLVDDPKYYTHQKEREDEGFSTSRAKGGKENRRKVKLRTGDVVEVYFETRPPDEIRAKVDDEHGDYIGSVHVKLDMRKGVAGIEWAGMDKRWRGKGLGSAVYSEVNKELKARYRLPLSSDLDGMRTDDSENLWKKLARLGQATKGDERYVMEGAWNLLEWDLDEAPVDVAFELRKMMSSADFKQLIDYVFNEQLTDDPKAAAAAVLSAMVKHRDKKKQAQFVRRALTPTGVVPPLRPGEKEI